MASSEINEFLRGPLVTWFISCLEDPNALTNYDDLVDGVLLHNVFLQIDPEPLHDGLTPSGGESRVRIKNLDIIVDNIKQFYEEQLGHLLLAVPNTYKLGKEPEKNVSEAKLLLLLLLGCAVQCSNKEEFITRIKTLNVDIQLAIVDCIRQVTDYQDIVITQESMENVNMGNVFARMKKLLQEKNAYRNKLKIIQAANMSNDDNDFEDYTSNDSSIDDRNEENTVLSIIQNDSDRSTEEMTTSIKDRLNTSSMSTNLERLFNLSISGNRDCNTSREEVHRYAVELADWKSKVRKQRQELEEKTEALIESKEELEHNKVILTKLREENQELLLEARTVKSYRDELDAAIEKAEKVDRLEAEVARYREKLTDIEYYKSRIEEIKEDNRILMETREMLEEQLNSSRKRSEKVLELESQILKYEQLLNDMTLERTAEKDKYQEVFEENAKLQHLVKSVASEVASGVLSSLNGIGSASDNEADSNDGSRASTDNRLSEQLSNNAQARALKLELENRRLTSLVESLKEQSFHESSSKMLELEKEKKKLSIQVESLNDNTERLNKQNKDLEAICKQTLEENKKLQHSLSGQRNNLDKQQQEIHTLHAKLCELERNYEAKISKERLRFQTLLESAEKRADDAERSTSSREREMNDFKVMEEMTNREMKKKQNILESKCSALEKEKEIAQRDVQKLRELIETKDVALDEATNTIEILEKKVVGFQQEIDNSAAQIILLREIERSSKELDSRAAIDREALENLQSNLVTEKLNIQQVRSTLEKIGLDAEGILPLPAEKIFDKIAQIPEIVSRVIHHRETLNTIEANVSDGNKSSPVSKDNDSLRNKVLELQTAAELLQSEKATLQVQVTRLETRIASLTSQQAALQLTNSRLEAGLDELANEHSALKRVHTELTRDQKRLQSLHEQLNTEYESLLREKDNLKANLRDAKSEMRLLRESSERFETKCSNLQAERDELSANLKNLSSLRGEHYKLKEDFRNLYTNTETLKVQYRNLQEDYRKNKLENNRLSLRQTEMQGELSAKDDRMASLELQISKLNQRCDILLQTNTGLDNDRRSLMEHISVLFTQYHELLSYSLEDKEHYHMEEKMYTDKVNHLYRQKEKLEEKIMEHYRKLESCSNKKKGLGASLVKRVRKAGSGLFNRSGRRSSWSINATAPSDDNSTKPSSYTNEDDDDDDDDVDSVDVYLRRQGSNSSGDDLHAIDTTLEPDALRSDDPLCLAHPGTRRTVYYTDDASPPLTRTTNSEKQNDSDDSMVYNQQQQQQQRYRHEGQRGSDGEQPSNEPRPLLIYNKVSAVINDSITMNSSLPKNNPDETRNIEKGSFEASSDKDRKTANSVWYEYGCV